MIRSRSFIIPIMSSNAIRNPMCLSLSYIPCDLYNQVSYIVPSHPMVPSQSPWFHHNLIIPSHPIPWSHQNPTVPLQSYTVPSHPMVLLQSYSIPSHPIPSHGPIRILLYHYNPIQYHPIPWSLAITVLQYTIPSHGPITIIHSINYIY
jgi:hypothetical protein